MLLYIYKIIFCILIYIILKIQNVIFQKIKKNLNIDFLNFKNFEIYYKNLNNLF